MSRKSSNRRIAKPGGVRRKGTARDSQLTMTGIARKGKASSATEIIGGAATVTGDVRGIALSPTISKLRIKFPYEYLTREMSAQQFWAKVEANRCVSYGCRRKPRKGRRCDTCWSRIGRIREFPRYVYRQVKESARKRQIAWALPYEHFLEFCATTGYLFYKGKGAGFATIDRANPDLGYSLDNIRIMEFCENASRQHDHHDHEPADNEPF